MPRRPVSSRLPGVAPKRSWAICAGERRATLQGGPHVLHLVDGHGGSARGGDRRADDAEGHPDHAQRRRRPERPGAVAGRDPRHAQQRQDREGEERDDEQGRGGDDEVRARPADRVAQRLDADPQVTRVVEGPERPVERREEPDVEDLHEHEQAQDRSEKHGQHAARGGGQQGGHGDDDQELEREPCEPAEVEVARVVRRDEGGPDEQQGEHRDRHGDAGAELPACWAASRRRHSHHTHWPIDAVSRASAASEKGLRQRQGQDPGGRDRQHDPLCRRDDLAPAARRQGRAHPRQEPLAGEEQVARGPDREHPPAALGGDVDAEGEDQERVDLAVEAGPQLGHRAGAPCHPSIDRVQAERDGREGHEQGDRDVVRERLRGQCGDADGERGPGERDPGRGGQAGGRTGLIRSSRGHSSRKRGESA